MRDIAPSTQAFLREAVRGLQKSHKELPCKYFYDKRGSELFDEICHLEEYYVTRTDLEILEDNIEEIAAEIGPRALLIEYGTGSGKKTEFLLKHLKDPAGFVPVDISKDHLKETVDRLTEAHTHVDFYPVCADFTRPFDLPETKKRYARKVVYFPGSTIGNFDPVKATELLQGMADQVGHRGGVLIGVDLKKDVQVLEAAYNDKKGVTANFNMNLLVRMNQELGANFTLERFKHRAHFNEELSCIEMHLESLEDQSVKLGDQEIVFHKGETIRTEQSHKYSLDAFKEIAKNAGMSVQKVWKDKRNLFSTQHLIVE